jgi:hypothetical protein
MKKGSKQTEEAKRKISIALRGRERGPVSPEHHARMCAAQQARRARERAARG